MNPIDVVFERTRAERRLALFPYLMAGYPTLESTKDLALAAIAAGADGLELGMPFSDPVADGVTIQRASEGALRNGVSLRWVLDLARGLRREMEAPLVLMSYYNPILHHGVEEFAREAVDAGLDGVIVPDLPSIEAGPLLAASEAHGLYVIQLIAPTSTDARLKEVGRIARGFVYCVSLLGTTGVRERVSDRLPGFLQRVRRYVCQPLLVGFGIARPEHIAALRPHADACVVASAIADLLEATPPEAHGSALRSYVAELRAACDGG